MRIRRRATASQAPDPYLQLHPPQPQAQPPPNVTQGTTQHPPGTTPLLGLHPDVDLSLDPHPSCIPSLNPNLTHEVLVADKQEVKEEEAEKTKKKKKQVDVDGNKIRDFHVNSNNKSGGRVLGERKAKAKAVVISSNKRSDEVAVSVNEEEEEKEELERVKKRRSPAVLMEGSRCSRVNGRGWRCCQQTLVGYSLCEHHLGKGRLRSMSSVRGQLGSTKPIKANAEILEDIVTSSNAMTEKDDNPENKCKKIGIVKARSISSLLG